MVAPGALAVKGFVLQCLMPQTITVRLPEKLRKDLERLSREDGVPLSTHIRRSLAKYVLLEGFERARAATIPYARAAGYLTEDDILKIDS